MKNTWLENFEEYKSGLRNSRLHNWASLQRRQFIKGNLSDQQIMLLKSIDFNLEIENITVTETLSDLEELLKNSSNVVAHRIRLLIEVKKNNKITNVELASRLGITILSVLKIKKKYKEKGINDVIKYRKTINKKSKLTPEILEDVKQKMLLKELKTNNDIYDYLRKKHKIKLRENSIFKYLRLKKII